LATEAITAVTGLSENCDTVPGHFDESVTPSSILGTMCANLFMMA
jgi:hypothetical protein